MFNHPAVRDALQSYLCSRHALRYASSELYAAYNAPPITLSIPHKVHFITLPCHFTKLDGVISGILRKGVFLVDLAEMNCFYEVVYGEEPDRLAGKARFEALRPGIAACVETIFIDCHWIGYVSVSTCCDGSWSVKPSYGADTGDAPFDFCAFQNELSRYLKGWVNLKTVFLLAPRRDSTERGTFSALLYGEAKRAVAGMKRELDNPHHLKVIEVRNGDLDIQEYTRKALAFRENARA